MTISDERSILFVFDICLDMCLDDMCLDDSTCWYPRQPPAAIWLATRYAKGEPRRTVWLFSYSAERDCRATRTRPAPPSEAMFIKLNSKAKPLDRTGRAFFVLDYKTEKNKSACSNLLSLSRMRGDQRLDRLETDYWRALMLYIDLAKSTCGHYGATQ